MSENGNLIVCWYCGKKTSQEKEKCIHCGTILITDQDESDIESLLESIEDEKSEEQIEVPPIEEEQGQSGLDSVPRPPITLSEEEFDFPPTHQPFTPPPPPPTPSITEEEEKSEVPKPMTSESPAVPAPEIPSDDAVAEVPRPLDEDQLFSTSQKGIPVPKSELEEEPLTKDKEEGGEELGFSVPMPAFEPDKGVETADQELVSPEPLTLAEEEHLQEQDTETIPEATVLETAEAFEEVSPIEEGRPEREQGEEQKARLFWPMVKYYMFTVPIVFLFGFTSVRLSDPDYEYRAMTFPDKNYVDYLSIIPLIAIFVFVVIGYLAQAIILDEIMSKRKNLVILAALGISPLAISSAIAAIISLALQGIDITVVQISLFGAMVIPWASFISFGWIFYYLSSQLAKMKGERRMAAMMGS